MLHMTECFANNGAHSNTSTGACTVTSTVDTLQNWCLSCTVPETNHDKILLHTSDNKLIFRWESDSPVSCCVDRQSFLHGGRPKEDVEHVETCLVKVIKKLNSLRLPFKFEYIEAGDPGAFTLVYQPNCWDPRHGVFLASSFFPGAELGDRKITLYKDAFKTNFRSSIYNILSHEFAHTLGMRHWNAVRAEVQYPSVYYPVRPEEYHSDSIMGPFDHPRERRFTKKDSAWLRRFYSKPDGSQIRNGDNVYTIKDSPVRPEGADI
ncbi:hypothetical protein F5Y04DRAFT_248998 [Hypomontagnella monticulosa]|nr:hypothetical protein F5Y04DRAFT_248998 [Hypomontagnella monticulosa]